MNIWRITNMEFPENQKEINSYFEIAKSKNLNFANNIHDYMFMYKKQNELFFKNIITRNYLSITI